MQRRVEVALPSETSAEMPPRLRETPPPWVQWAVLLIGALVAYGAVIPDFYMSGDDFFATRVMDDVDRQGHAGMIEKLYGVFFQAAGIGHFRPIQDVIYVLFYEIFGVDRWIRAVTVLYVLCHLWSGRLITLIMNRLGCAGWLGLAAALLFVLHPVWDENLASVQFGNNVPALTSMLGAAYLWLPVEGEGRSRTRRKVWGGAALVYVAIGLGINMMASAAVLFTVMAIAIAARRRSVKDLLLRGVALGVALLVSAVHRLLANGAIGTQHAPYVGRAPTHELGTFAKDVIDAAVLLTDSPTAVWVWSVNPPGLSWGAGPEPLRSLDTVIVVAAALAIAGYVVWAALSAREASARGRYAPAIGFGLLFAAAMVLPYFLFVGLVGVHRYIYPAVAGLVIAATAVAGAIGARLAAVIGRRAVIAIGSIALAFVLGAFLRVDRESARSIAAGHRFARSLVETISAEVRLHPEIKQVFVVGQPLIVGRSGYVTDSPWLRGVVNARVRSQLNVHEQDFLRALGQSVSLPLPDEVALYVAEPDGFTLRRVRRGMPEDLPIYVIRSGYHALLAAWRLNEPREVLARLGSPDPRVAESMVRILFEVEGGERRELLATALERYPATSALTKGVLEAAWRDREAGGRKLAALVLQHAGSAPEAEKVAIGVLASGNPKFDATKAKGAVNLEQDARALAAFFPAAKTALAAFEAAEAAWREIGVARPDLERSIALSRLAVLDEEGLARAGSDGGTPAADVAGAAAGLTLARQKMAIPGVSIRAADRDVAIENRSPVPIPGSVSPISGRLLLMWLGKDGEPVATSALWLPQQGIRPGETWTMTPVAPVPKAAGAKLRVELKAFGIAVAAAELPAGGSESRPQ